VYYHLARVEETHFQHPDDIDNNVEKSILFKHGKFIIPVVDILCNYFKNEIERIAKENNIHLVRKTFYPEGQLFGIALTHDVDFIRAFHPLKKILLKVLILLGIKRNLTIEKIEQRDKLTWGFDKLLSYYKENNLRATFFFMAKYIEGWHFRYRIASKKMRILIAKLKSLNHEIAFHPSRYAFETPKRYLNEKQKLEKISGISVSGLRHHYLRCLYPQLWQKATQLDLKYDAGMVHRRYNGFRAGTSFPFQTFDHKMQERIEIIEFSTIFFENTLPDKGTDYEASKKTISQLLETVKIHGGLLNILWHSNNIYQPKVYSDLWNFIVNSIKEEDAFNQPLIEQYDWHKLREKIQLQSFKKLNRGFTVKIALPDGINRFSLHVPENYNYKCDGKFSYDKIKKLLTVESNIPNSIISIEALAK
jgi:peptidoglycan/xylan/chitin deacetylase (PgdA/CDA1 family)